MEDKLDGTVEIKVTVVSMSCWVDTTQVYSHIVKKCLQGQVYRQEQNDCKGTGSAADYYGASKLQWCESNDTSCDTDLSKSPAYTSCANDTTAGKSWNLFVSVISSNDFVYWYDTNRSDEIPNGDSDYYWTRGTGDSDSEALAQHPEKTTTAFPKNTPLYVLCSAKE